VEKKNEVLDMSFEFAPGDTPWAGIATHL